ncbi:MAG: hypothetical protein ACHQIK_10700 [Candidatus Acidiferrales bacterium]
MARSRATGESKGVYAGLLVENLGDVSAFLQHGYTQMIVFDCRGAAVTEGRFRHGRFAWWDGHVCMH